MKQTVKLPLSVALAQKFVSEVFLTDKWDHLFRGGEKPLTLMPREASPLCPTEISWDETQHLDGYKLKVVTFSSPQTREHVFVTMRGFRIEESVLWYPNGIKLDNILVHKKELAQKHGERIHATIFIPV